MQDHFPVKANARPFSGEGVRFKSCGVPPPQEERRYILNVPKNHYRRYARKNPDCGYGIIIIFTIIHHPISGGVLVGAGTKGRSFWKKISGRQRFANFAERVVDAVEPRWRWVSCDLKKVNLLAFGRQRPPGTAFLPLHHQLPDPGGPTRRRSVEITRRASPRGGTPIPH